MIKESTSREVLERILAWVHKPKTGGCWLWQGADSGNGYGRISVAGKTKATHILVYEYYFWPAKEGDVLDHLCRNRHCCSPYHLVPRSQLVNTLIGVGPTAANARKVECLRGHPLKGDNLILSTHNGRRKRDCRACRKIRAKQQQEANLQIGCDKDVCGWGPCGCSN